MPLFPGRAVMGCGRASVPIYLFDTVTYREVASGMTWIRLFHQGGNDSAFYRVVRQLMRLLLEVPQSPLILQRCKTFRNDETDALYS